MAARDRLGGLADATRAAVVILSAAFDYVFVETVGVGQSEVEVADIVDTLIFVSHPDSGDLLQSMKAGILEVPDILVVNKADLGEAAERSASELETGLALSGGANPGAERPVLVVSAREGTGIDALIETVDEHRREQVANGSLETRRARFRDQSVLEQLATRYGSFGLDALGGSDAVAERIRANTGDSGAHLVTEIGCEIEATLKGSD